MSNGDRALLLISASVNNADMYHAIGFLFGDPVLYLGAGYKETLVCTSCEVEEARPDSRVSNVLSPLSLGFDKLRAQFPNRHEAYGEMVRRLLESQAISAVTVTDDAPISVVDYLRGHGVDVVCDPDAQIE